MTHAASATRATEERAVETYSWPKMGAHEEWGELVTIFSRVRRLGRSPYATHPAASAQAAALAQETAEWLAAGMMTLRSLDAYIDELPGDDDDQG